VFSDEVRLDQSRSKKRRRRTFGPLTEGTLRSPIVTLAIATLMIAIVSLLLGKPRRSERPSTHATGRQML